MKKRKGDDWFPFWIDKWLFGSTRDELEADECSVLVDLMCLAYKDEGFIRANEGMPYSIKRLAGIFNRSEELIERTIKKCLDPKIKKIKRLPNGTLFLLSSPKYELSERHKRRVMSENADIESKKPDAKNRGDKNRGDKNRGDKNRGDRSENLPQHKRIKFNFKKEEWQGILIEDKSKWKCGCPDIDIEAELYKMKNWLIANGPKKNYARFIVNWLNKEQGKIDARKRYATSKGRPLTRREQKEKEIDEWKKKPIKEKT